MKFTHAIIHSLEKEENTTYATVALRPKLLDVSKAPVVSLGESIAGLLGKPGNSVTWGQFLENNRQGLFPPSFDKYSADPVRDDEFIALTHVAMTELKEQAEKESFATGGYVYFGQYDSSGSKYLIVAMIKKRSGLTLSDDFEPLGTTEVDLNKLHQAARINIDLYVQSKSDASHDDEAKDSSYLCFIGRRSKGQASAYFIEALGCAKGNAGARITNRAIDVSKKFIKSNERIKQFAHVAATAIIDHMWGLDDNATVTIDDLFVIVSKAIPVAHQAELDGFKEYLNSEENRVPTEFLVNRAAVNKRRRLMAGSDNDGWKISFEKRNLGETDVARICYNKERAPNSITINNLPDEFVKEIQDELAQRPKVTVNV